MLNGYNYSGKVRGGQMEVAETDKGKELTSLTKYEKIER
jgi:hypothetical protein